MWYIVKSRNDNNGNDNEDYNLNENDIIKFGRRKFEIIKKKYKFYHFIRQIIII